MTEYLDFWIVDQTKALGGDVAGLRTPDAAVALVIDGFATSNGKKFDFPPFGSGRVDVTMMAFPAELGERLYEKVAGYIASRQSRNENVAEENEVIAAKWAIDDDTVLVMVGDSAQSLCEFAQDAFERYLGFEKIHLHSSREAVIAPSFDAREWLDSGQGEANIRRIIESVALPASSPAPARGPKI